MNKIIANNISDRVIVHDKNDECMIEFIKKDGYFIEFYQGCSRRKKYERSYSKKFLKYGNRLSVTRKNIRDLINYCESEMNREKLLYNLNNYISADVFLSLEYRYRDWYEEWAFMLRYNFLLFESYIITCTISETETKELIIALKELINYNSEDIPVKSEKNDTSASSTDEDLIEEEVDDNINFEEINDTDEINENNESSKN